MNRVEIKNLYQVFHEIAPEGFVDRRKFKEALKILEKEGLNDIADTPYADRLFTLLDVNEDNVVDFKEFIAGFALLCKGTPEEKIRGLIPLTRTNNYAYNNDFGYNYIFSFFLFINFEDNDLLRMKHQNIRY